MNVLLLGAPGVGKGTMGKILSEKHNVPHIVMGDIFRETAKANTQLGKEIKKCMDKGVLVPDELTIGMLRERLSKKDCQKGFILDGYPRNISQAKSLEGIREIDASLNLNAPREVIMQRLSGRRTCRKCHAVYHIENIPPKKEGKCDRCGGELYQREDEEPEVVKTRLDVYEKQTRPLIEYYRKKGLLREINAGYPAAQIDKIIKQCDEALKNG